MVDDGARIRTARPGDDGVGVIAMLGGAENYLTVFLLRELANALHELAADPDCGAIVVRAEGKHFCAGRDWRTIRDPEDTAEAIYACAPQLIDVAKPWVAELTGGSIGVGLGVAMCADHRVAAETAYLWPKFVGIGIHHGFGLTATLTETVGRQRATELLSTGRKVSMLEAERIGLVDRVARLEDVSTASVEFAALLAAQPREALAAIRGTMRAPLLASFEDASRHERAAQERLYRSADFQSATDGGYRYTATGD
ncbi:enoyl-CoA hydratase/isomerase family protein [Microbacterium sp. A82]|uniref:enoyl-CoA hydratase/isomerase family protein n=1 Tax=Microbacterium sp. A82 TaxID=3450452 RepID=UPI003F334D05